MAPGLADTTAVIDPDVLGALRRGANITDDAPRRHQDLIALRPRPNVLPAGVSWIPLPDAPEEKLLLALLQN